tara:strand:+ start:55002 stop:55856 length:855 start_codon:yes stop_codon:yes gene_type:complete
MAHKTLAIIAVLSLVGVVFLVYLALTFEPPQATRTVELDTPIPRPVQTAPTPAPTVIETAPPVAIVEVEEPVVAEETVPEDTAVEPVESLPPLNDSDQVLFARLAEMELGASLLRLLAPEDLIRKFVVYAHNASLGELPQLDYPLRRVQGEFVVREIDTNLWETDPASHRRYDALIDTLTGLEPQQAMSVYRALKPLFQEAYAEIGFQDDFDQVLISAIDQVMNAPQEEGPFQLIKPSVMYLYADSRIEDMSPVQKQLLRIGPENTAKLQARLPAYRERLRIGR